MNETETGHQVNDQVPPEHADHPNDQPTGNQAPPQADPPAFGPIGNGPLYRPYEGRLIGGVAAGIGQYLGVDVTIIRIALAVLAVMGGAGIPIYVAGWLLIPDEGTSQSIASEFISSLQARSW